MTIEYMISSKVNSGEECSISLAYLEKMLGDYFFMPRLKQWVETLAKELGVKATIHIPSDCVTFYPKVKP